MLSKAESPTKSVLSILSFKSPKDFEQWLAANHSESPGIWVQFYKKDSGTESITHAEALDEALCCGWIDGQLKKYDDNSWLHKFTPRGSKSIWSKRNIEHAERLITAGKMKHAGLMEIEKAKKDGRWQRAYDSPATMELPEDFIMELSKNKMAKSFFETLNRANKYSITWRLQTAAKPETRLKRMKSILEMLEKGEKFH